MFKIKTTLGDYCLNNNLAQLVAWGDYILIKYTHLGRVTRFDINEDFIYKYMWLYVYIDVHFEVENIYNLVCVLVYDD